MISKGRNDAFGGPNPITFNRKRGRAAPYGAALCAVIAFAAAAPQSASAGPADASYQLAQNRPVLMLRRSGEPPAIVSYDPEGSPGAASRDPQDSAQDEVDSSGRADADTDALGRGVNHAAPVRAGAGTLGAAFDPALIEEAERLRRVKGPVAPHGAYAAAIQAAIAEEGEPLRSVYFSAGYAPIWIDADGGAEKAKALIDALGMAHAHALPAGRYGRNGLAERLQSLEGEVAEAKREREERVQEIAEAHRARELEAREQAAREREAREATDPDALHAEEFGASKPIPVSAEIPMRAPAAAAMELPLELDLAAFAALERDLTKAYLSFASDLSGGAIDPAALGQKDIDIKRPVADPLALAVLARRSGDIGALAASLPPQTADYQRLLAIYATMRAIEHAGGWGEKVVSDRSIRPLDRGEKIDALRARLVKMGDLRADAPRVVHPENGQTINDEHIEAALKRFQRRHGLAADGVAGAQTKGALNVTVEERVRQVAVNLERARWMNKPMDGRRIQVNIPDFHVDMLESGAPVFRSRVVVGKPKHQTPEFEDEMTEVIVNPFWHVPYSIATKELLPELQRDRNALKRQNIEVYHSDGRRVTSWWIDWDDYGQGNFPFHMRQNPGPGNALGMVKFIFPNHHSVYLHDTPAKSLFTKARRAFSHGCIRVHKPHLLATTLLGAQSRNPEAEYSRLRAANYEQHTPLKKRVPVHIVYRTAWVEEGHGLQLREDIYGRDAMLAEFMEREGVVF